MTSSPRHQSRAGGLLATLGLAVLGLAFGGAGQARAELLYGLVGGTNAVNNSLVAFDSNTPGTATTLAITGLTGSLRDIDFRPATGVLYGLSDANLLYTINTTTGLATQASVLNTSLSGNGDFFGIDFNPVVDRLRVVNNAGQNLRIDVDTGEVTRDTNLTKQGIIAAAYTNNFAGATTTTLYDLSVNSANFSFDLNTQNLPNAGTINLVGPTGIPGSPPFQTFLAGFDISGVSGIAYAATTGNIGSTPTSTLFRIDLATGASTNLGLIGFANGLFIRGLAAPIGPAVTVPEPASLAMLGLGLAGGGLLARRRRGAVAG